MRGDKRVELHLTGGLGNQLFQYSAGLHLANLWKSQLELNLTRIAFQHTELSFNITSFILDNEKSKVKKTEFKQLDLLRTKFIRAGIQKLNPMQELEPEFEMIQNRLDEGVRIFNNHLFGYYGDFRFFDSLKPAQKILNLVRPSQWFRDFLAANQRGFNAIHIRLGDYLSNINHYGVLSPNYYLGIFESLSSNERSLPTYVFTDDVHLSKLLLSSSVFKDFIFVQPPAFHDPAESLMIMSQATHLMAANSTFSFWGAKLASPHSRIFVPSVNPAGESFVKNIPAHWEQIEPVWMNSEEFKRIVP